MLCPRCNRPVTDRHGICRHCRENAFQCRLCRNINYENLDGFLCNECGYCKHARFDYSVACKPSFMCVRVLLHVSSYCYVCVLIFVYRSSASLASAPSRS
jgi:hypothetical protein